jgi:CRP/FNR family transcriptional regulator
MHCANSKCPFYEFRSGERADGTAELDCIVNESTNHIEFADGEVLFMQGQPSRSLYSLSTGMVKICTHTADGREQIVGLSSPRNLLVGLQSLNDERYAYTAIAASRVKACRINHRALVAQAREQGDVALRLVEAMNAQLAHSRALMEVMGHHCAVSKIASLILLMTPESAHGNCDFSMPFSRVEMANLLGLSEETVCRAMARMKREGAIYAPRGHIEIRDWDRLQEIADEHSGSHALH